MRYLLDTNHWSYLQQRHAKVIQRLKQLPEDTELLMSVIAQAELLAGVEFLPDGVRKAALRALYEHTVAECTDILPIDSRIAERAALIMGQLRRDGRPIKTHDIWVAATALVHDLTVATNNEHFRYVSGLRVEDWTA